MAVAAAVKRNGEAEMGRVAVAAAAAVGRNGETEMGRDGEGA